MISTATSTRCEDCAHEVTQAIEQSAQTTGGVPRDPPELRRARLSGFRYDTAQVGSDKHSRGE